MNKSLVTQNGGLAIEMVLEAVRPLVATSSSSYFGEVSLSPNFTIVTLGVKDFDRAIAFYRALGWEQRGDPSIGITWFRTSGCWIGLFGYEELATDAGMVAHAPEGFRGVTLALNFNSESEVDDALTSAVAAGGELIKAASRADWGGYSGYFADPDGHLWETAFAPGFPVAPDGTIDIH